MKTILQPYPSVAVFAREHALILPKPRDGWRLLERPCVGEINALVNIRGVCYATNGVMVAIKDGEGKIVFGHLDWFVPDGDVEDTDLEVTPQVRKLKTDRKMKETFGEFL